MRIIGPLDQKPFFGVAIAVSAGLMLGGAMKPDLNEDALFRAPQLQSPESGERVAIVDQRASLTAYRHGTPDWVVGTDWLQPQFPEPAPEPEASAEEAYEVAAWEPPPTPVATETEPEAEAAEPSFPSMGGDILNGVGPRAAAEPPIPERSMDLPSEPLTG